MRNAALALGVAAAIAGVAAAPPGMVANVYRLSEAAALLQVCTENVAFRTLPDEKARHVRALLARLESLAKAIGRHYDDPGIHESFERTKVRIAGETSTKGYAKTIYQYCGDRLLADMEKYVSENETLINGYFERQRLKPPADPSRRAKPD